MTDRNNRGNNSPGGDQQVHAENGLTSELMQNDGYSVEEAIQTVGVGMFQVKLVILSGFVYMARAFDSIIIYSIISLLACDWKLQYCHGAIMTTICILSMILGCFLYGFWSDVYGRRMALTCSLIFLFVFSAVSAGLPSFPWFVTFRVVAAFSIGGLPQSFVLCCEYMPSNQRGRTIYILSCFWALGLVLMKLILYWTVQTPGTWRVFVSVGSIPAFLAMVMMRWFPESFRFLLVSNQYVAANEVMLEMAEVNKKDLEGHLYPTPGHKHRGRIADLFSQEYIQSTLLLWWMGLATAITYMGLSLITSQMMEVADKFNAVVYPSNVTLMNFMGNMKDPIICLKYMPEEQLAFTVWTGALDFPGFVIYLILVDLIDRKKLLCASFLLSSLFVFLLFIPTSIATIHVTFLYCAKTLLLSQFDLLILIVAETFPTTHRGTVVGLETASIYLGKFFSSYISQALMGQNLMYSIIIYGIITLMASIAAIFLKHETRGKDLTDTNKKK